MLRRSRLAALATVLGVIVVTACVDSDDSTAPSGASQADSNEVVHVHDLLVGSGGSPVFLATHTGLYALRDGELLAASDRFDDLMAAAIEPNGTLIASGHPDLSTDDLRVEGKPPLLGLVASDDGSTWKPRSLLGDADFHAFAISGGRLYGADSTSARVQVSDDGGRTWEARPGEAQLVDLAINSTAADQMVGVDLDRGLVVSTDRADSWESVRNAPELIDLEWTTTALVGIDAEGGVHRSTDAGLTWAPAAPVHGAEALGSDGNDVYAFSPPVGLHRSSDGGESWSEVNP